MSTCRGCSEEVWPYLKDSIERKTAKFYTDHRRFNEARKSASGRSFFAWIGILGNCGCQFHNNKLAENVLLDQLSNEAGIWFISKLEGIPQKHISTITSLLPGFRGFSGQYPVIWTACSVDYEYNSFLRFSEAGKHTSNTCVDVIIPAIEKLRLLSDGYPDIPLAYDFAAMEDVYGNFHLSWQGSRFNVDFGDLSGHSFHLDEAITDHLAEAIETIHLPVNEAYSLAYESLCESYMIASERLRFLSCMKGIEILCQQKQIRDKYLRIKYGLNSIASRLGLDRRFKEPFLSELFQARHDLEHEGTTERKANSLVVRTILRTLLFRIAQEPGLLDCLKNECSSFKR